MSQSATISANILEILARSQDSGEITTSDRSTIKTALLQIPPDEDDLFSINRLLYALRRGWLKLRD